MLSDVIPAIMIAWGAWACLRPRSLEEKTDHTRKWNERELKANFLGERIAGGLMLILGLYILASKYGLIGG